VARRDSPSYDQLQPIRLALELFDECGSTPQERFLRAVKWAQAHFPDAARVSRLRKAARVLDDLVDEIGAAVGGAELAHARSVVRNNLAAMTGEVSSGPEGKAENNAAVWYRFLADEVRRIRPDWSAARVHRAVSVYLHPGEDAEARARSCERIRRAIERARAAAANDEVVRGAKEAAPHTRAKRARRG
jgi:hypothetical protein